MPSAKAPRTTRAVLRAAPLAGIVGGLCAAGALAPWPETLAALRVPCALALVLYLPGACVLAAAFPGRRADAEIRVLSVALSLALAVLAGLCLNLVGALTARGWALALGGLSLATGAASVLTRRLAPDAAAPPTAVCPAIRGRAGRAAAALALLALALLLGVAAVLLARSGALAHREYRYTEFWLVPQAGGPALATLGLHNGEQAPATYEVDIVIARDVVARWPAIALAPGETRTVAFAAPPGGAGHRVEAWLYKDGDRDLVYRKVWMAVPGPVRSLTAGE